MTEHGLITFAVLVVLGFAMFTLLVLVVTMTVELWREVRR